jgi:isocitrate/isopropylmalate dehydrogenase
MMLEYLNLATAARDLRRAIDAVYAHGRALTPDQGGSARTTEFCEAVLATI